MTAAAALDSAPGSHRLEPSLRPARAAGPRRGAAPARPRRRAARGTATRATTCSSLRALVQDGVVPLLGPPTSIGDVHHGAWYYYLLSPAACLTGGDSPLAVVALIALAGIAAVGVVWWLARSIGGPVAGCVAGLRDGGVGRRRRRVDVHLEPEPHRALERRRPGRRVAGVARRSTALVARRRARDGGHDAVPRPRRRAAADRRGAVRCSTRGGGALGAGARSGVLAIFVAAYLPLVVNELTTGFSELAGGARLPGRRSVGGRGGRSRSASASSGCASSPGRSTGLITDGVRRRRVVATVGVIVDRRSRLALARRCAASGSAVRWLGPRPALVDGVPDVAAPSLASVVPGLPNDHYHAFADPMVFVLVGLGVAAARSRRLRRARAAAAGPAVGRVVAVVGSSRSSPGT